MKPKHLDLPSMPIMTTVLVIFPYSPKILTRSSCVVDSDKFFTKTLLNFVLSKELSLSCLRRKGPT
uniref:Uncharacterized protein n=1 Tax=Arundo donax TaxID=35708 RepID=A0A0A9E7A8_ARUDO